MANPTRILFISGEVAPFAKYSELAEIVRVLPEKLQETGEYEMRIMMPRYGTISERRNRLHEVIRLSSSDVPIGSEKEALKVKVASIPGIRLQVYFMDNNRFFKRKGILGDRPGKHFDDNPLRALFFARATLQTIRNLGWTPDIVHAFGTISAFVPALLRSEFSTQPLFQNARIVFTPDTETCEFKQTSDFLKSLPDGVSLGSLTSLNAVGQQFSDALILPPEMEPTESTPVCFRGDMDEMIRQATAAYDAVLNPILA